MINKEKVVLITGAAGRIGFNAMERLSRLYIVVGMDLILPPRPVANTHFIQVDLSSKESVHAAFQELKRRVGTHLVSVIHLAAYYNFSGGGWDKYQKITIGGTEKLLDELQNFQVEEFIFSSTMLVYAPTEVGKKLDEDASLLAKWDYPLSKIKTEEILRKRRGMRALVLLRIAGVYDDVCHSIPISEQIKRIYEKKLESYFFPGDPTHGSAYVHMEDLVDALLLAVEKRSILPNEVIINIGESQTFSYKELQQEIGALIHGKPWPTFRIPKWVAKCGAQIQNSLPFAKPSFIQPWMIDLADDHYELDIDYAFDLLGWLPKHMVITTLPSMVEALKKDPAQWIRTHRI